jgi:DNA-binding transcriptional MerR regulator
MIFLKKKEVESLLKEIKEIKEQLKTAVVTKDTELILKEIKEKLNTLLANCSTPKITVTEPCDILKDIKERLDHLSTPPVDIDTSKLNITVLLPDEKLIAMSNNMALMIIDKIKSQQVLDSSSTTTVDKLKEQNDVLQKKIDELTENLNHQTEKINVLTSTIDSFYFENELVKKQLTIEEDLRNCYQEIETIRDTITTL